MNRGGGNIIFGRVFSFMKPYRKGFYLSLFLVLGASALNSLGPFLLGRATDAIADIMIDGVPVPEGLRRFGVVLAVLSAVYLSYCLLKYGSVYILVGVAEKSIFDLRSRVDEKLSRLPLNYFDSNTYGDILSRVTNDVDTVSTSLQQSVDQVVTAVTTAVFIFIMMLVVSPILTLVGVIMIPLSLWLSIKIAHRSRRFFQDQQNTIGVLNGYVEEMYTGHVITAAFGREELVIETFRQTNRKLYDVGWKAQFLSSLLQPVTQAMTNFGYVCVAVLSAWLCIAGNLTVGMIQSFIQYLRQFSQPILQVVQITNILQSTAAAVSRIFAFLDETEEISETTEPQFPTKVKGRVTFDHVRFGYLPHRTLIRDVNLDIPAGSKVAIVGPTGAGKTTLVNLLLRFYDVTGGSLLIDGVDVRQMERRRLRSIFGMVPQDTWLFTGTVRENLRYGCLTAKDEEVEAAAKAAHAHNFIRALPGGYDMELIEGGGNLAQGERQLLTIARAILSDCPIMILDEATSSVDTRTEVLIQQAMQNLMRDRTSFVIAHRLSTIRDADMILYMQDGDVMEVGTHEELIARGGLYEALYNSQFA